MENKFDLVVIGAGSGGLAAAKRAAKYGASVAIIEFSKIGGTCVIRGCVPKKLMVYAANARKNICDSQGYGLKIDSIPFESYDLLKNIKEEVSRLSKLHRDSLSKLNIKVFEGKGRFINANEIEIFSPISGKRIDTIIGQKILISVGGKPMKLKIDGSDLSWSSDDIFELEELPNSILIVGGGYIACEFACILNNLGIDVTQLIRGKRLLNEFDKDLATSLKESMIASGIELIVNDELSSINKKGNKLELILKSGGKKLKDNVLMATGRNPNLEGLNLENLGIKMNGIYIETNKFNQTNVPNIFAIGDVIDKPNLTPVAIEQGRVFSDNFFGGSKRLVNYKYVPKAVFTNPEIATVGLSEEDAIDIYSKSNIRIYKCKFTPMSSTFKKFKTKCLLKLVVNNQNDQVIGCHMFGESASEIIQMVSIAINSGVSKKEFDNTMALHPSISEEFVTMYG